IILPNGENFPGHIQKWNETKNTSVVNQPISDEKPEKFVIGFPNLNVGDIAEFELRFGNVLDRVKTPIVFKDISLKKK
ncbi:MAG: hypothetical protein K2K64_11535, partial [Muribaculaceae bacterium]|nr:hypothetical protein [Muribaculaceae bacterium]